MEAVAQTYNGKETNNIIKYSRKELEDKKDAMKSGGIKYPIKAAINNLEIKGQLYPCKVINPYSKPNLFSQKLRYHQAWLIVNK